MRRRRGIGLRSASSRAGGARAVFREVLQARAREGVVRGCEAGIIGQEARVVRRLSSLLVGLVLVAWVVLVVGGCRSDPPPRRMRPPPPAADEPPLPPPSMGPATGQPAAGGWELLGERRVDFRAEHDVIPVGGARGDYRRLQLRVDEAPIEVLGLQVHFEHGQPYDAAIGRIIPAGEASRVIDLPGAGRRIDRVSLRYRTPEPLASRRALVRVWGQP